MQRLNSSNHSEFHSGNINGIRSNRFRCYENYDTFNYLSPACNNAYSHISYHSFVHNNSVLEFHIVRSYKRKKTSEILVQDGIVYLRTPFSTPLNEMETLLRKKSLWISKKVKEQTNPEITIKRAFYNNNSTLPYLGKNYPLTVIASESLSKYKSKEYLTFSNENFAIYSDRKNVRKVYEKWLFEQGPQVFSPLITKYSNIIGVSPKKILLKNLSSRWGSATFSRVINLNIHLLKAPTDVIEYVIIHELCHLLEHNHSSRFWKLVSNHMANYKTKVRWLKINGPLIL